MNTPAIRGRFLNSHVSLLTFAAAIMLLAGHFLPWAAHTTAALTQSAHDLAISTNFTPNAGVFANEWFLGPLWVAVVLMTLAARRSKPDDLIVRVFVGAFALGIASLGLPTYPQVLTAWRDADYRVQFFVTLFVFMLILAITFWPMRPWQGKAQMFLTRFAPVACAAIVVVPLVGFFAIKPAVEALYNGAVGVGLGWWITLLATLLLFIAAGGTILQRLPAETPRQA